MNIFQRFFLRLSGIKSMADLHPEFLARESLGSYRADEIMYNPMSYLSMIGKYGSYVWVRKAIKVLADNLSSLPVNVTRDGEIVPNHPASQLLVNVNEVMSSSDLWQQWVVDMMLGGEEFWEFVGDSRGNPIEIWPRQPHIVKIVPDAAGVRYRKVAQYVIDDNLGEPYDLKPEECIHFKFYNPENVWRGISPFSAVKNGIIIDTLAQAWSMWFLKRNARPDYGVVFPQGATKTEKEALLAEIEAQFGGAAEKSHKPIGLEEGISDIKILSFPPKDLEWVEQRKLSRAEVAAIAGVPDEIMGYGKDTYENFDTSLYVLWTLTLMPLAGLRDTTLTEYWVRYGLLADNEKIKTDYREVEIIKKFLGAKIDQAVKLFGMGVPFNKADKFLGLGIGDIPGGDTGYLPFGLAPIYTGRQVEPPAPAPTEPPPPKSMRKMVVFGSDAHKSIWDAFVKRTDPQEVELGDAVRALLVEQQREVMQSLAGKGFSGNGHSSTPAIGGVAMLEVKDAASTAANPFDLKAWIKKFRDKTDSIIKATFLIAAQDAAAEIGTFFSLEDPNVRRFLEAREQRFAQRVNETTWQQLKDTLGEGVHQGESIPKLEERISATMELRKNQSRETIARTEVVGASNGGTLESWRQSGIVQGKTWIATFDDRVRDSHANAHGQTVGIDEDFVVGNGSGPAPGQINLPEESINCRCTMTSVLD